MGYDLPSLSLDLHRVGAVKFGEFTLKSGVLSPIYIDLRVIISYPDLLKSIAELMWNTLQSLRFELLCGVPYTALPIATAISIAHDVPMVMRRKEKKDYGTKKMLEGVFHPNQTCLIVEDIVSSGGSILETAELLRQEGLVITKAMTVLDREQGGKQKLKEQGIELHSLLTLSDLLSALQEAGKVSTETVQSVKKLLKNLQSQ